MRPNNPSYVFDFLACKIYEEDENLTEILNSIVDDFSWVEVKSSGGKVSRNQILASFDVTLPITFCVVNHIRSTPDRVRVDFYYDEIPDDMIKE